MRPLVGIDRRLYFTAAYGHSILNRESVSGRRPEAVLPSCVCTDKLAREGGRDTLVVGQKAEKLGFWIMTGVAVRLLAPVARPPRRWVIFFLI